jgi:hypothetical protein
MVVRVSIPEGEGWEPWRSEADNWLRAAGVRSIDAFMLAHDMIAPPMPIELLMIAGNAICAERDWTPLWGEPSPPTPIGSLAEFGATFGAAQPLRIAPEEPLDRSERRCWANRRFSVRLGRVELNVYLYGKGR